MARDRVNRGVTSAKDRLPITIPVLSGLLRIWSTHARSGAAPDYNQVMLCAAASLCFYGFFQSGEIMVSSASASAEHCSLWWGDVAVDQMHPPASLRVHLKRSKMRPVWKRRGCVCWQDRHVHMPGDSDAEICGEARPGVWSVLPLARRITDDEVVLRGQGARAACGSRAEPEGVCGPQF